MISCWTRSWSNWMTLYMAISLPLGGHLVVTGEAHDADPDVPGA
jgi:hypothetical protein